jgi:hypothetical protein
MDNKEPILIDANSVASKLQKVCDNCDLLQTTDCGDGCDIYHALVILERELPVDARLVQHGYWSKTNSNVYKACSICGAMLDFEIRGMPPANYCISCGAVMDKQKENEYDLEYDDTCPRNIKIKCADCACYWCEADCNYCKLNPAHPDCLHYKNPFGGNEYDKSN